ncbi:hypothetical protein G5I_06411 [Acromyrmex echinatior]|uniref:Uncharacterized protein n=1 Tax=Acromyrmex echinatior TaxID=103372 RepID=F4WKZ0_ACREC|nr:hypothetical protein G5I_06411 [Acromyrmex echinatior]
MHHKCRLSIGEITPGSRLIYDGVIAVCTDTGFAGTNDRRYPKLWTSQIKLRCHAIQGVRYCNNKLFNVLTPFNYADKNNTKPVEIENAGEEKKKNRKTKEKNPVMNGGCSRFNESPRWSSMENKENLRGKRSKKLEMLEKNNNNNGRINKKLGYALGHAHINKIQYIIELFLRFTEQMIQQHVGVLVFPNQEECLPRTRRWLFGRVENKSTFFRKRRNEMPPARFRFRKPCNLKVDLYRFGISGGDATTENGDEDQLIGFLLHDLKNVDDEKWRCKWILNIIMSFHQTVQQDQNACICTSVVYDWCECKYFRIYPTHAHQRSGTNNQTQLNGISTRL